MSPWNAASPGDPVARIDTPALILDLDAFERNLVRMKEAMAGSGVRLRPHAKSHKCPHVALIQIALGAVGICCQKVSEAAAFVDVGVNDILITNQIVGVAKFQHLMALAKRARIGVLVDHTLQIDALATATQESGASLDVYVEVDVGANRCGVAPGAAAVLLAVQITAAPGLRFAGLHCYQGSAQHLREPAQRAAAIARAAQLADMTRKIIESQGIEVPIITGAGTGTFIHERDSGVYQEVQAGSYVFMDRDYADNIRDVADISFEHSLFVATTVMSRPNEQRAVVDAGLKASSVDSGLPRVWQRPDITYAKVSDEHGVLTTAYADTPALGDQLWLVPGHCDPTVNLYDQLVCVRDGIVESLWPIVARGAVL
jgi:D-serine deaminase-like pyridoxal phosphate-dependent protein